MLQDNLKRFRKEKGFSQEQQEFNAIAPLLMTGVDSDPTEARRCRDLLRKTYAGYLFCPGHGTVQRNE